MILSKTHPPKEGTVKKEYLDFLYESRANIQRELEDKEKINTFPEGDAYAVHKCEVEFLMDEIQLLDKATEAYLRIHA